MSDGVSHVSWPETTVRFKDTRRYDVFVDREGLIHAMDYLFRPIKEIDQIWLGCFEGVKSAVTPAGNGLYFRTTEVRSVLGQEGPVELEKVRWQGFAIVDIVAHPEPSGPLAAVVESVCQSFDMNCMYVWPSLGGRCE